MEEAGLRRVDEFIRSPRKALFSLSLPLLITLTVHTLYSVVDTAFVGRLGSESLAALTFSFPLFFLLIAFISGVGTGVSSKISRCIGRKDKKTAENAVLHGIFLSLLIGGVIYLILTPFLSPILSLLGAKEKVLPLSLQYMRVILAGIFLLFPSFILNRVFAGEGDTLTPMKVDILSLLSNIALDPLFIFTLRMGVKGAALATVASFFFSLVLYLYFLRRRSLLMPKISSFHPSPGILKDILTVGLPATLTMVFISIYSMIINRLMAYYGVAYVASLGMVSRLSGLAVIPIIALSMPLVTLTGIFKGAGEYELLKETGWFGVRTGLLVTTLIGIPLFLFPEFFLKLFTLDPQLLTLGSPYLKLTVFTYPLMALGITTNRILQGMGLGLPGLVANLVRTFGVSLPLAFIFVYILNLTYLWIAIATLSGGLIASLISLLWLRFCFLHLGKRQSMLE